MKKIIVSFLIFQSYLPCAEMDIENINSIFHRANTLYEEGDYLKANHLYRDLASSNIVSKNLYYNLASSYYGIGSNGYAILWYERAFNMSPFDEDIKKSIILLNGKADKPLIIIVFYAAIILFVVFFTSLALLFAVKRKIYYSLFALCIISAPPSIITYDLINSKYLIATKNALLYDGGSLRARVIDNISEGKKLRILEEYGNWYYVKGDFKGWIGKEFVEKI